MILFLSITCVILLLICVVLTMLLYRFGIHVIDLEDQIEASLDILDSSYKSIVTVLDMPVTFDDPYIHRVLNEIRRAKHAVLLVANCLGSFGDEELEESSNE